MVVVVVAADDYEETPGSMDSWLAFFLLVPFSPLACALCMYERAYVCIPDMLYMRSLSVRDRG